MNVEEDFSFLVVVCIGRAILLKRLRIALSSQGKKGIAVRTPAKSSEAPRFKPPAPTSTTVTVHVFEQAPMEPLLFFRIIRLEWGR
jgi:hypothetical protein